MAARRLLPAVGFAALAGASAALVLALASISGGQGAPRAEKRCERAPHGTSASSARRVGVLFVRTAVLRRNEACSYDLVTRELRQGMTRAQWATGNIPVQPFPTSAPRGLRARYTALASTAAEWQATVLLEASDLGRARFELVLVERGGRWLVGYWGPAPSAAVLGSPAMPS